MENAKARHSPYGFEIQQNGIMEVRVDIVRFAGGLGNQMFQYALVEALRNRGRDVRANLGFYKKHPESDPYLLPNIFTNIQLEYASDSEFEVINARWQEVKRSGREKELCGDHGERFFWVENVSKEPCTYQPDIFLTKNCTFVGYWQTEKYFKDIRDSLLFRFRFNEVDLELEKFAQMIADDVYVSVHVRRGDYLLNHEIYMGICTKDYYLRAIEYIRKIEPNSKLIFFSDDLEWVKDNFDIPNAIYCSKNLFEHYEDWYDMYLMSKCRHNIIANSSFSWWGAWLNQNKEKIIVAPSKWIRYAKTPDIWCEGWVSL